MTDREVGGGGGGWSRGAFPCLLLSAHGVVDKREGGKEGGGIVTGAH